MAAYRTAGRLFPGLHLPLLGMGMEYHRMSNLPLAEQLFRQAHAICPIDPLVCNELGVLAFRNLKYAEAEAWFTKAVEHLPDVPSGDNLHHVAYFNHADCVQADTHCFWLFQCDL